MWWLAGCVYHLTIDSRPASALVVLPDASVAVTPAQIELRWAPFRSQVCTVSARGYRTVELDLARHPIRRSTREPPDLPMFRLAEGEGPPVVLIELVPEHGPVGTWTEADLP